MAKTNKSRDSNQLSLLCFWGKENKSAATTSSKANSNAKKKVTGHKENNDNDYQFSRHALGKRRCGEDTKSNASTSYPLNGGLFQGYKHKLAPSKVSTDAPPEPECTKSNDKRKKEHSSSESIDTEVDEDKARENPVISAHQDTDTENSENYEDGNDEDNLSESEPHEEEDGAEADSSESSNRQDHREGLSDYELLRLRNIERNNERLKALGLVTHVQSMKKKTPKSNRPKKRPKKSNFTLAPPTRKSSRLSKSNVMEHNSHTCNAVLEDASLPAQAAVDEEPEQFDMSPVIQYEMEHGLIEKRRSELIAEQSDGCFHSARNETFNIENISALVPTKYRLSSPQGLSHIYSLNFYNDKQWLVGAGKSGIVALWNCQLENSEGEKGIQYMDPIFSWKAHGGRWISEAQFISPQRLNDSATAPSKLVTAANDGTVCLWDLSKVSTKTGAPKLLQRSDKSLHSNGIFAMDVHGSAAEQSKIVTGSKDKVVAIVSSENFYPIWRSHIHTKTVKAVKFRDEHVVATASDDGCVGLLDDRVDGDASPIALLEGLHSGRPHSVIWDPVDQNSFLTAGLDTSIQAWDMRYLEQSSPVCEYYGHVPANTRCKRIHHPVFYPTPGRSRQRLILTGGEGTRQLSMFSVQHSAAINSQLPTVPKREIVYSCGRLPDDCNDAGTVAIGGEFVAVSVDGGNILMLEPSGGSSQRM